MLCIFADKNCHEACVAYNSNEKYGSQCQMLNSLRTIAKNSSKE